MGCAVTETDADAFNAPSAAATFPLPTLLPVNVVELPDVADSEPGAVVDQVVPLASAEFPY